VRGALRSLRQRAVHQRRDLLVLDLPRRARTGLIQQSVRALPGKALAPFADGVLGNAEFRCNRAVAQPSGRLQHDPGAQGKCLRRLTPPCPTLKLNPLRLAQAQNRRHSVGHLRLRISPNVLS
jgi:hypothetical protein